MAQVEPLIVETKANCYHHLAEFAGYTLTIMPCKCLEPLMAAARAAKLPHPLTHRGKQTDRMVTSWAQPGSWVNWTRRFTSRRGQTPHAIYDPRYGDDTPETVIG
jgi:hypothetical protein